tara:strand:- start:45 stop:782 length:738 start_codon:yes stop_codon:yes gene_type:complete
MSVDDINKLISENEERAKELVQTSNIMLGMPCYGGNVTEGTFSSCINLTVLASKMGLKITFETISNESFISRGRNSIAAKFLAGNFTHLMFVDADVQFNAEDILKLLLRDKDIVGGIYPQKVLPTKMVVNTLDDGIVEGDLIQVGTLGTGFLMTKRCVFEKLIEENVVDKYVDHIGLDEINDFNYTFYDSMIDTQGRYLTDDWAFCRRSRQQDFIIWADSTIELIHSGYMRFYPDMEQVQKAKEK